ncbi:MAG: TolB family protein [Anaerolineales bacterium]
MRRFALLLLAAGIIAGGYGEVRSQTSPPEPLLPIIGWAADGELWIMRPEAEPQRLAEGGLCCAVFSPDGEQIAFVIETENNLALGWVSHGGGNMRRIPLPADWPPGALPGPIHWQGGQAIWVNAFFPADDAQRGVMTTNFDLWRYAFEAEQWTRLARNGQPFSAPDGERVAIVDPGEYNTRPGGISIWQAGEISEDRYTFEAVSSGSHLPWMPMLSWHDTNLQIRLAIPPRDLLYNNDPSNPALLTEVIAWQAGAPPERLATIDIAYPARVVWAQDGQTAAYLRQDSNTTFGLVVHPLGGEPQTIREGLAPGAQILGWDAEVLAVLLPERRLLRWHVAEGFLPPIDAVWNAVYTPYAGLAVQIVDGYQVRLSDSGETLTLPPSQDIPRLVPGIRSQSDLQSER